MQLAYRVKRIDGAKWNWHVEDKVGEIVARGFARTSVQARAAAMIAAIKYYDSVRTSHGQHRNHSTQH